MKTTNRPLSPFMIGTLYKPQLTSTLSFLHRATGVALVVGSLVVTYWLAALAVGPEAYANATAFLGSWFGKLLLFGWTFALFYHLFNGMRHLAWDMGYGFDLPTAYLTGKIVVGAAAVMTIVLWLVA